MKDSECFNCGVELSECTCGDSEGYSSEGAVCPYCGYLHEGAESEGGLYNESMDVYDCSNCGNEFGCSLSISYSWTTHR